MPTPADRATLETDLREALAEASARRSKTVVSVTLPYGCADPIATVFASRRAGEPFFCWEQPDRNLRLAALGRVHEITSRGPDRFVEVAADCAHLSGDAVLRARAGSLPARSGPEVSPSTMKARKPESIRPGLHSSRRP